MFNPNQINNIPKVPVYLIYGGDPQQTLEAHSAILLRLRQLGFNSRHSFNVDNAQFDWAQLNELNCSQDLFSNKQILELRLKHDKLSAEQAANLTNLITALAKDVCLLIIADKLAANMLTSKWFTTISKHGYVVAAKPIPANKFQQHVITRFNQAGYKLSHDAALYLTRGYAGNTVGLAQLLAKLNLCIPTASRLDIADLAPFTAPEPNFSVFELIDRIIAGDDLGTITILNCLTIIEIEPIIILWAFTREVRTLINIHYMTQCGTPFTEACKVNGVWSNKISTVHNFLAATPITKLESLLKKALAIDIIAKNITTGLVWESLLTVCLQLAGAKLNLNLEVT